MTLYLIKRLAVLVASTAVAGVVVFAFMALLPGDPAEVALGVNATPDAVAALRKQFGTDRPPVVQFFDWFGGLLQGDFGTSYVTSSPIGPQISDRLGVTAVLVLGGMLVALVIAVPLGTFAAVHHRNPLGAAISALSQVGIAIPAFLAGILLVFVFAVQAQALPSGGYVPIAEDPAQWLLGLLLPWLSLGLVQGAVLTRYVRSAVLDVMREDYLRTARAKGRGSTGALWRHGLRNASIPVVTVLGLQLATLLIGAVVVERVFVIPGLGDLLLNGVAGRDLLLVQGVVMVLVAAVLLINFVVDVAYRVLDPRLR
ncbi:ABC transporter permease [Nonomuraea angiospora]|uniref:Peptide/nickel transport system permease protein n=1 Tax=Nonomuraea angiospora TaxID=46172 RepID=A0ABR9MLE2_9ACTN|nr:ABC transporter permease [Nonomuraea angiospora]MBE1593738.1 peptide/nickel transport system permease protein [Nonomuraea angiospora]MDX3111396.1 ABC transporter permease [Nonomuraea angiospora]